MDDFTLINIKKDNKEVITGSKLIIGYIGLFMMLSGIIVAIPLISLLYYYDCYYAWWYYLVPALLSISIGFLLYSLIRKKNVGKLLQSEAMFLTIFIWIIAILINAIPFYIWGHMGGYNAIKGVTVGTIQGVKSYFYPVTNQTYYYVEGGKDHTFYYFTQAIFESTSGFCSVGLTLLPSVKINPGTYNYNFHLFSYQVSEGFSEFLPGTEIFQLHRALLTFVGGIGLVLILTSALSDKSSFQIYLLEGHSDKLLPNLAKSARSIFLIYVSLLGVSVMAYCCCGMTFFDSLCYSMAALSTGGFATHSTSMMFFELALGRSRAIAIETITIIMMFLGAVSFLLHHFFFHRNFKKVFLHYENLVFILIIIIFLPMITVGFSTPSSSLTSLIPFDEVIYNYYTGYDSFRHGIFEFFSFITTTGFSSIPSYKSNAMSPLAYCSFIILPILGGMGGSTAGGIKLFRIGDIYISLKESLLKKVRKQEVVHTNFVYKYGEKVPVSSSALKSSVNYSLIYLFSLVFFTLIIICFGYPLQDTFFEVSSSLAGLGETSGLTMMASNLHHWGVLWTLCFSMLLGRLEIVIALVMFIKIYQDVKVKRHRIKY